MPDKNAESVRLNKYIAECGVCSRREADQWIEDGRVTIDGRPGVLGDQVLPGAIVAVDGRAVWPVTRKVYLALHKPIGIVCTADPREPMNVIDYLNHPDRVFPIGRLDKDSAGLLLMTNDGDIVNRLLRAAGKHEKEYIVTVDKPVTPGFLRAMSEGVEILDTVTLPCRVEKLAEYKFKLVLVQGLNRQIRRMCDALHYRVTSLKRVRIMNIELGRLKPGDWRNLTESELKELFARLNDAQ